MEFGVACQVFARMVRLESRQNILYVLSPTVMADVGFGCRLRFSNGKISYHVANAVRGEPLTAPGHLSVFVSFFL